MENLLSECRLVYRSIDQQIKKNASRLPNELHWIEWSFALSLRAWTDIEQLVRQCQFLNSKDEMEFYKFLKPKFVGLICHFPLLYQAILFMPDDITERNIYWESELDYCNLLICEYKGNCQLYENQPNADRFFGKQYNQQSPDFGSIINMAKVNSVPYNLLLGKLVALEKFRKFLQVKVCKHISIKTPLVA
jgi:hypothetical protein